MIILIQWANAIRLSGCIIYVPSNCPLLFYYLKIGSLYALYSKSPMFLLDLYYLKFRSFYIPCINIFIFSSTVFLQIPLLLLLGFCYKLFSVILLFLLFADYMKEPGRIQGSCKEEIYAAAESRNGSDPHKDSPFKAIRK